MKPTIEEVYDFVRVVAHLSAGSRDIRNTIPFISTSGEQIWFMAKYNEYMEKIVLDVARMQNGFQEAWLYVDGEIEEFKARAIKNSEVKPDDEQQTGVTPSVAL